MARVQLLIPDEDRDRFVHQARREGLTFSAWLRAAAHARLEEKKPRFSRTDDLSDFFRQCDARRGGGMEPDWKAQKRAIEASRLQRLPSA